MPAFRFPNTSGFAVHGELLTNYVFRDSIGQLLLEAVCNRHQHVIDALVFDETSQEGAGFSRVVVAQVLTNLLDADLAREVDLTVLEKKASEFLHDAVLRTRANPG